MSDAGPATDRLTRREVRVRPARDPARPATRFERFLYRLAWWILAGLTRLWFSPEVHGAEHIPADGPFILAPVHRSYLDFGLAVRVLPPSRRVRYLAKDTLWKGWLGRLWEALGGVPVHRGGPDREALRACIDIARAGEALGMFPEGTRQTGPEVFPLFDGPAFVQARTGVPIVPLGIGGSEAAMPRGSRFPKRHKVVLVVGEPLAAPDATTSGVARRSAIRSQTARLHEELQQLFDEAQRLAGTPNVRT